MTTRTVIAYWLVPSEPARNFFREIVNDLAVRYDAPVFEPHVTVHVGTDQSDAAEKAFPEVAQQCKLIRLTPLGIDQSDEFIKTLFVQFVMSSELQGIHDTIRAATNDSSQYELKPHLSLLYKKLPSAIRAKLVNSITVPFSDIPFGSLQAVRCVSPTKTGADVKGWELISSRMLQ